MVSFGERAGKKIYSAPAKPKGGGSKYALLIIPKDRDLRVRFLEDPEDWFLWYEHYSEEYGFFPCTNDATCGGCSDERESVNKRSTRYLASVYHYERSEVRALKVPLELSNDLAAKVVRSGSWLIRDCVLYREGSGLGTKYKFDQADPSDFDVNAYDKIDPEEQLAKAFQEAFAGFEPPPVTSDKPRTVIPGADASVGELMGQLADQVAKRDAKAVEPTGGEKPPPF